MTAQVKTVVFNRDGWNYIAWGINVSFMVKFDRSLLDKTRKVSFGFMGTDGAKADSSFGTGPAEIELSTVETLPWGGVQIEGAAGTQVTFTYVPL
ncbi:MAG: hypothetical protein MUE44_03530 [Oscillatoriaceae cyanobacterium Prado104]|jgi:hypothetical protein|nr:hypothetical protein [Oscillatoriaceae cyanobacterium Prado104]